MSERQKRELYFAEYVSKGMKKSLLQPPLFRLLWRLGIDVPPPHFLSGGMLMAIYGIGSGVLFVLLFGPLQRLLEYRDTPQSVLGQGAVVGLLFALFMPFWVLRQRDEWQIKGSWREYEPPVDGV